MKALCPSVGNARTTNGSGWVGEQGEMGGDRGFSEGKLGKGIAFEMQRKKDLIKKIQKENKQTNKQRDYRDQHG